jgi:uncharacterized protein (TIGR02145 family)
MRFRSLLITFIILIIVVGSIAQETGTYTDSRDGQTYKTVKIGTQVWMVGNLSVNTFRNGDIVPEAKTEDEWKKAAKEQKPAWCYYNNDTANGKKYGKLYNWYAINDKRGLAPNGWHVSKETEWIALDKYLGKNGYSGEKLKDTTEWIKLTFSKGYVRNRGKGTNESGFTALSGGGRSQKGNFEDKGYMKRNFFKAGYCGIWWSSTEYSTFMAYYFVLWGENNFLDKENNLKSFGLSVRCIRD